MYTLEEIHDINYEFLLEIQRIAKKHDIKIFLDSGTLLGAVREKDFIKWDDDTDLSITRKDYNKLIKVIREELDDKYEFLENTSDTYNGYFFDFVNRCILKEGNLRKITDEDKAYNNLQNKVAFDLFILENSPDNAFLAKLQILKVKMLYGMAMGHRYKLDLSDYTFANKLQVLVLSTIGKMMKLETIMKKFQRIATKYNDRETENYFIPSTIVPEISNRYKQEWFKESCPQSIRGHEFDCPQGYDGVLTVYYGDYMTPPPVEERVPMHMDLE